VRLHDVKVRSKECVAVVPLVQHAAITRSKEGCIRHAEVAINDGSTRAERPPLCNERTCKLARNGPPI
jgi:hypothetical protein